MLELGFSETITSYGGIRKCLPVKRHVRHIRDKISVPLQCQVEKSVEVVEKCQVKQIGIRMYTRLLVYSSDYVGHEFYIKVGKRKIKSTYRPIVLYVFDANDQANDNSLKMIETIGQIKTDMIQNLTTLVQKGPEDAQYL